METLRERFVGVVVVGADEGRGQRYNSLESPLSGPIFEGGFFRPLPPRLLTLP